MGLTRSRCEEVGRTGIDGNRAASQRLHLRLLDCERRVVRDEWHEPLDAHGAKVQRFAKDFTNAARPLVPSHPLVDWRLFHRDATRFGGATALQALRGDRPQ